MAEQSNAPPKRDHRFDFLYFIAMMLAVLLIRDFLVGQDHVQTISYTEFRELVDKNAVKDLVVGPTRITGTYVPVKEGEPEKHFTTVRVDAQTADDLTKHNISSPDSLSLAFLKVCCRGCCQVSVSFSYGCSCSGP